MSNEIIIGTINRFGCEYKVIKNHNTCFVQDSHGNEFKLSISSAFTDADIIENAKKVLKSAGL